MKNKTKKRVLAGVLGLLACVSAAGVSGAASLQKSNAEVVWNGGELKESYVYLTEFSVPAFTISANGKSAAAESVVIFPDGTATKNTKILLSQSGKYEIRYTAAIDGRTYCENKEFSVIKNAYYCTGSGESKAEYKPDFSARFPYTWWNEDNTMETRYNDFKKPGLLVELKQGDKFECANLIDVENLKKTDLLFGVTAIPYETGVCDFERLDFVLTDSADPNISLRIRARGYLNDGDEFPYSYILAGGQNQALKGYEEGKQLVHVDDDWGTGTNHSFYGTYNCIYGTYNDTEAHQILKLYYDAQENAVYTQWNNYRDRNNIKRVIDFDDPQFFSEAWGGFPSGKAKLSIEAGVYSGETARFLISEIAGLDLSETVFEDREAPEITVDCEYETMPQAARGEMYPVPAATAFDEYFGKCAVKTSVWYNYGMPNAVLVPVSGGKFRTDKTGTYAIVYESFDGNKNRAAEILWVECAEKAPAITLELSENGYKKETLAGEYVEIARLIISGGSGKIAVKATATIGNETIEIRDGFVPQRTGIYAIEYTAADFIGQTAKISYELSVTAGETPIFGETPSLPAAYLDGFTYKIPYLYADDYSSGTKQKVLASVKIIDASGEKTYRAGDEFIPAASDGKRQLTIVFSANGAEAEYGVPCVKTKGDDMLLRAENYFITDSAETEKTDSGIIIRVQSGETRGRASFANPVLSEVFEAELSFLSGYSAFNRLNVTLSDSVDRSVSVSVSLVNGGNGTTLISGENESFAAAGYGYYGKPCVLSYSDGKFLLGTASVVADKTNAGAAFSGFPSGKVYVEFEISEAERKAAVQIDSINGQTLSSNTILDFVAPQIYITGNYGGSFEIGATVTLPKTFFADVLDPAAACYLTVTKPNGEIATDVTGKELKNVAPEEIYGLALAESGTYGVSYTATDAGGNVATRSYSLKAEDRVAPELSFGGEWKDGVLQESYVFPQIVAKDNLGGAVRIRIMIADPNGTVTVLKDGVRAVKFAVAGKHVITVAAIDESGNVTSVRVEMNVRG